METFINNEIEIQYDLKPNGVVIRINNDNGCILRICGVPKELVFDKKGWIKEFIDITYPKVDSIKQKSDIILDNSENTDSIINQTKIPIQDEWIYPLGII